MKVMPSVSPQWLAFLTSVIQICENYKAVCRRIDESPFYHEDCNVFVCSARPGTREENLMWARPFLKSVCCVLPMQTGNLHDRG
jgi:hypothetical protein